MSTETRLGLSPAIPQVLRTHRALVAERTWERLRPLLPLLGITRIADVTRLDTIGVPVFQAVRPNARTLSVSQGKGFTPLLARISAAMESLELWHSERPGPSSVRAVADMAGDLPYSVFDLPLARRSVLSSATRVPWVNATTFDGEPTWVPSALVHLDHTASGLARAPLFASSSNGLASGNTLAEALAHALYEILERHALAHADGDGSGLDVDLATVTGSSGLLLERFRSADVVVRVRDLSDPIGVPCFDAVIWSRDLPIWFMGAGCHRDPDVALTRALTEAAQSRLTLIAGTRDDMPAGIHHLLASQPRLRDPSRTRHVDTGRSFAETPTVPTDNDLDVALRAVSRLAVGAASWVDLTDPVIGIPVVKVIAPGLAHLQEHR